MDEFERHRPIACVHTNYQVNDMVEEDGLLAGTQKC